jgi:HEPN domain-containing protein
MRGKLDLARGWFRKADSDLHTAQIILAASGPYDTACFHAQQAVEKYPKGFILLQSDDPVPRTHNLEDLYQSALGLLPEGSLPLLDLAELTPYAVETRYDFDFWPDRATGQEALDLAQRIREGILALIPKEARP